MRLRDWFYTAVLVLLNSGSAGFAASPAPSSSHPADISGNWILHLGPRCTGPLHVSAPLDTGGTRWTATLTAVCDGDVRHAVYSVRMDSRGGYDFSGTVIFDDGTRVASSFDLYWTRAGDALADLRGHQVDR
ncbi:MAG TPA: hypothetical protein VMV19_15565 [Xanthobacteraceae bacterium]|nr:hypothetical protein [Xanthobacteraceae bacterium]